MALTQIIEIRASEDDEAWEVWHGTHLFAVLHSDIFTYPIMDHLETRRAMGLRATLFKLEPLNDVLTSSLTQ